MKHIESIVIDGEKINNIDQIHRLLKNSLNFPSYYGSNLNALWDMLVAWVDFPLTIEWKNFEESRKKLGSDADELLEFFLKAESKLKGLRIKIT